MLSSVFMVASCFNPRSREGSDAEGWHIVRPILVSIHAPVKGATPGPGPVLSLYAVSIHAPVKGATKNPREPRQPSAPFQSTLP